MENVKLQKWADLLLDTGKRNNLINFKDTKLESICEANAIKGMSQIH